MQEIDVQKGVYEAADMLTNYLLSKGYKATTHKERGSQNNQEVYISERLTALLQAVNDEETKVIVLNPDLEEKIKNIFADDIVVLGNA